VQVTTEDVFYVAQLVQELTGVILDESKAYLIESRLATIARNSGCSNYRELCLKARSTGDRRLQSRIIDAITTHETLFFRDSSPFETLRELVIPQLLAARSDSGRNRPIRIWSAGCSTGQEPYSIAMTLWESIPNVLGCDVNVLGTDVSDASMQQACLGRYLPHEIQRGLSTTALAKFFRREGDAFYVKDDLRSLVTFRQHNLLEPFSNFGPFDIIFCRNVAIYFDPATRRQLFLRLADRLTSSGYLFAGSSESCSDLGPRFKPQYHGRGAFYRPQLIVDSSPAPAAPR
jgi:chemotaxis protein methyltransferase CheR